ncbi:dTDP-glucose 4,6-dehydratase [Alkalicoccobacillus porphyridii]|uniref:dTDP-glucose 4,6-dehydratase n=1 Tax=Alkalicoccobacillus porphyridii TaxID=2597270 RepID=A0A554A457_9BACI|nr:dTDP-glucose 4,6-dehydratase [Alkalicoccobacillus porphyridii]TSB48479.1 dTDP-glucose 4,6-dehydratase [Alkalicoccobacillus porphyridii]
MKLFVTGGAGFIGSHFIRYILDQYEDYEVINFDALTYAGNLDNVSSIADSPRYQFVHGDITNRAHIDQVMLTSSIDAVVHFAAESHVDRSIESPGKFVETNVIGTQNLLDCARLYGVGTFVHISTDEVYGTLPKEGYFTEETPLAPNSPYAASKASADMFVRAYYETYGMDTRITRCSNNYGPNQYREKLIPVTILRALDGLPIPLYGDGQNVRDWLHVHDHCTAIDAVLHKAKPGSVYNIGSNNEWNNIDLVEKILDYLEVPRNQIARVTDRLGHDRRYAIDASRIKGELGWQPMHTFEEGLKETIDWFTEKHRTASQMSQSYGN